MKFSLESWSCQCASDIIRFCSQSNQIACLYCGIVYVRSGIWAKRSYPEANCGVTKFM